MPAALSSPNIPMSTAISSRDDAVERRSLTSSLLTGMSALGVSLGFERGATFFANVLAARLAGTEAFGAYSLALTTANNVASYAGAGIGTTANRFVGQYPPGSRYYRRLLRVLLAVSLAAAAVAAMLLWLSAAPLAGALLHNSKLKGPLQIAAFSAAAFILVECCRGLLIGQRSFSILLLLSLMVGGGFLAVVPVTARFGPRTMLAGQAGSVFAAVIVSSWFVYLLAARQPPLMGDGGTGPSVWRVWSFGLVQLISVIGAMRQAAQQEGTDCELAVRRGRRPGRHFQQAISSRRTRSLWQRS